jgi:hypothetical protein
MKYNRLSSEQTLLASGMGYGALSRILILPDNFKQRSVGRGVVNQTHVIALAPEVLVTVDD